MISRRVQPMKTSTFPQITWRRDLTLPITRTLLTMALVLSSKLAAAGLLSVDYNRLVARADLSYDTPASRSDEGMPVGNGRMGSLVWTTPSALKFQTAQHRATSILGIKDGRITLTRKYQEAFEDAPDFYDASAVAIGVMGHASRARYLNDAIVQLSAAPGRGRFTILIASAASFDPEVDVAETAITFVEIHSLAGNERRLRNPWGEAGVTLYRDGRKGENAAGALLEFGTRRNETIVVVPQGTAPKEKRIAL